MNNLSVFLWAVLLLLLQILVFNNINFPGAINPYLYVTFIFIFPLFKNRFIVLFFSFLYGLTLDFFTDTGGVHAFSLLFVAYLRLFFIKLFFKKKQLVRNMAKLRNIWGYLILRLQSQKTKISGALKRSSSYRRQPCSCALDRNTGGIFGKSKSQQKKKSK